MLRLRGPQLFRPHAPPLSRQGAAGGGVFQTDGGLSFIGDVRTQAQRGGDGVEQAPGAGRGRAVEAPAPHLADRRDGHGLRRTADIVPVVSAVRPDPGQGFGGQTALQGQAQGDAPGLADGGLPAGQTEGRQTAQTLPAGRIQFHEQQLSAPDALVRAQAGAIQRQKKRFEGDKERAMAHAINATFKSVIGSSITTVAGFIALCFMTFSLGRDMGVVMAKGVVIGVLCCVTLLPALVLTFDGAIEKTTHKTLIPSFDKASAFITKHYKVWLIIFLVMLFPAIHGNNNLKNYYNIDKSLPSTLDSNVANAKLQETFDMNNVHMVLLKKGLTSKEKTEMLDQIKDVDGVKWALGMDSFVGAAFPDTMIPSNLKKMLESDEYEMEFICSKYKTATDEVNNQIDEIQKIVKGYSPESMVIGEAPLTKDLQDVTDVDLKTVNTISILAIFIIIMVVFKSISLPFILVAVIEFAIFVNMSVPYYQGKEVVFVASIVIGCIQLGATVDYAILMTSRYQKERGLGKSKKESIAIAHKTSMKSIVISGCSFFAATFGVGLYTQVDMIGSITNLLSRGAVISTLVVLFILPAMFMIFDSLICHTSIGFAKKKPAKEKKQ
mgnify:CR=1 FL=1